MADIKVKDISKKSVKVINKAVVQTERFKDTIVRTKEKAEESVSNDINANEYASDKIRINVGADNLNFNVSGVVISRGGLMEVNGIKNFTITYDPDLSNEVMEKYIAGWTKITDSLAVDTCNANNDNSTVRVGTFKAFNRI